jgi:hypothetical protein
MTWPYPNLPNHLAITKKNQLRRPDVTITRRQSSPEPKSPRSTHHCPRCCLGAGGCQHHRDVVETCMCTVRHRRSNSIGAKFVGAVTSDELSWRNEQKPDEEELISSPKPSRWIVETLSSQGCRSASSCVSIETPGATRCGASGWTGAFLLFFWEVAIVT